MRKLITLFLCLLLLTAQFAMAEAPSLAQTLSDYGITGAQAEALAKLLEGLGDGLTEEDILALLAEFATEEMSGPLPGTIKDTLYEDPSGYAMTVPDGWTLQPEMTGPYVVITGPEDARGYVPTITVLSVAEPEADFLTYEEADLNTLLSSAMPGYLPIETNDFDLSGTPAKETVFMVGEDEASMLMVYQITFSNEGKAFLITMTTLAEETAHQAAQEAYDAFLETFEVYQGQGNG